MNEMTYQRARRDAKQHAKISGHPTIVAFNALEGGFLWVESNYRYLYHVSNEHVITMFDHEGKEART